MAKSGSKFLALLRGINVGGHNLIPKEALKQCFEELGFGNVRTYIQSGNILFRSDQTSVKQLTTMIEEGLSERFDYEAQAVVLTQRKYKSAVDTAHDQWGQAGDHKHNAMFTLSSTTPKKVLAGLPAPKSDIETVTCGPGVIFWSVSKKHLDRRTSRHPTSTAWPRKDCGLPASMRRPFVGLRARH